MRPFSGNPWRRFSTLFWYSSGQFFDTRTDSIVTRYWPEFYYFSVPTRFDPFPVLPDADCRYSDGFYLFQVLARILPFFSTQIDSTLFRYSPAQIVGTWTDSSFSRYMPGFYHFSVLTKIRPFSGTPWCRLSILGWILPFPSTRPDSTIFGTHTESTLFR